LSPAAAAALLNPGRPLPLAGSKSGLHGSDDARRFAQSLTLHVEWEGMSEPPLLEAHQALQWAEENPTSPIVPVARLFAAHR
jgi:hypothetical protein